MTPDYLEALACVTECLLERAKIICAIEVCTRATNVK